MAKKKNNNKKNPAPKQEVVASVSVPESEEPQEQHPTEQLPEEETVNPDEIIPLESPQVSEPLNDLPTNGHTEEDVRPQAVEEEPLGTPQPASPPPSASDSVPESEQDKPVEDLTTPTTTLDAPTPIEPEEVKPEAPAPKKRLTLQERLALAAKSKKSTKRNTSTSASSTPNQLDSAGSKTVSPEPQESLPPSSISTEPVSSSITTAPTEPIAVGSINGSTLSTRDPSLDLPVAEPQSIFPSNFKDLSKEELHSLITDAQNKFISLESKSKSLTEEKLSLQEKVKALSSNVLKAPVVNNSSSVSEHILKEKDEKIAQLMREGEELSKKELKFNNTIKKLKSKESDNDYEIQELNKKVSNLELELKKNKEMLKKSLESEQQASVKSKSLQKQLDHEKNALIEEIGRNEELSHKIEELSQTLVQEKNRFSREINELKRQLEREKSKLVMSKEEHSREVARLEGKIEQLRFQAENAQTTTTTNDDGYLKLLKQYDILQTQYTSATENWQSIEASLMAKISNFENEVLNLTTNLTAFEQKSNVLSRDLAGKISELESATNELRALKLNQTKLETKLKTSTKALEEVQETFEAKEIKLNQERTALEYKVQTMERQLKDNIQPQLLMVDTGAGSGLGIGSPAGYPSPSFSRNASAVSFKQRVWDGRDISLGESSTTPIQSRKASAIFPPRLDYFEEGDDSLSDFGGDNESVGSPVANYTSYRQDSYSSTTVGAGGASVQLIGKMSGQVRRLQMEISTMREDVEKLTEDKKAANEEIVRLMKDNEEVGNFKARITELEAEIDDYSQKHDKMLIILGEKSEQVEELKADVVDLKDMLKQQVQQMIELQGK